MSATWPSMPGVFPDYPAPVIRNSEGGREMVMMRWGMPPPPRTPGAPVTNIRNTSSPHWRIWLRPEHRCLVPFNSFAEYSPETNPKTKKKDVVWFARGDERPLSSFAGIWTEYKEIAVPNQSRSRTAPCGWPPHHQAERGRRADTSEGHARDTVVRRGARGMVASAVE